MALLDAHTQPCFVAVTAYLANTAFLKEKTKGDRKKSQDLYEYKSCLPFIIVCVLISKDESCVLLSFTTKLCPQPTNTILIKNITVFVEEEKQTG